MKANKVQHYSLNLIISLVFCLLSFAVFISNDSAFAQRFGSRLTSAPNTNFGCELAPIFNPITGVPSLVPTGQTNCTLRNAGYINNVLQLGSYVPGNGTITEVRVRSGANPAALRVVIMQCSPGLCGTAVRFSRVFRPRANRISRFETSLRVDRSLTTVGGISNVTDAVGITAVGAGTLPLVDQGSAGTYASGSALLQGWYPGMQRNVPRNEGYTFVDGLELLLQWRWVKRPGKGFN